MESRAVFLCLACFCLPQLTLMSARSVNKALNMIRNEITDHQVEANKIMDFLTKGPGKHQVYDRLKNLSIHLAVELQALPIWSMV